MAVLYFKVQSDWENVVKLRNEITKLENQLKSFGKNTPEHQIKIVETQLGTAREEFTKITTEAAKAGAAIDNDFKKKIFDASQSVNDFTEKIIAQKSVVKDIEADVKKLGEAYRIALKNNSPSTSIKLDEYRAAKRALDEEKAALFGLTQEQAEARLSVKRLRDEYALFREDAGDSTEAIEQIKGSLVGLGKNVLGAIGVGVGVKEFVSQMVKVRSEFQAADTAIQTLLGSKEKADALMSKVREYAKISPLEFSDVTQATQMMLGFNIEVEKIPGFIQAIGDVSMGESEKFNSLTLAFSQMSAAGKLMGQDLNQMINAGFNPLQIMADKTGKSIAQLKDEMSKGAISAEMVQQAFIDATSAGGKFYQMSENASKTIQGQLSMMQDALDAAFNEMGQASEGFIMKSIQLTTSLIENYETIGKILIGLIATYGAYKTATLAALVIEQARNKTLLANIAATKAYTIAQTALNAAMKANPYVLLATAVVGLGTAMWALRDSTTAAEKATNRYNAVIEEQNKKEQERKQSIESLIDTIQDHNKAEGERLSAFEKLKSEYPDIFDKYTTETEFLKEILKYKKLIAKEDNKRSMETDEEQLRIETLKLREYENRKKQGIRLVDLNGNGWAETNIDDAIKAQLAVVNKAKAKISSSSTKTYLEGIKEMKDEDITSVLDDITQSLQILGKSGNDAIAIVSSLGGEFTKEQLSSIKSALETEQNTRKNKTTYQQDLAAAKADWEKAKAGYEALIKDQDATSEQRKKAREEMQAKEKAYKNLGGDTTGKTTKEADKRLEQQQKLDDQLLSLRRQNQQDEINLMGEGTEKKLKQIELDYQKELDAIKKQEEEWKKAQGGKLTQEQTESITISYVLAGVKRDKSTESATNAQIEAERQAMNEYLKEYGDYMEKRQAIADLYNEEIAKATTEGERLSLGKKMKEELAAVDDEAQKKTSVITKLFDDMSKKTVEDMRAIADEAGKMLSYLNSGEFKTDENGEGLFGLTKEQFEILSKSPEKLESIKNEITNVRNEADAAEPALKKVANGLKDIFSSGGDSKKLKDALSSIRSGLNEVMQTAGFLSDSLSSLGDSLGMGALSGIAEGISTAMGVVDSTMKGAEAGAMFGPIGSAAGAALGAVSSLASAIAGIHDRKNEKRIQKLQDQIDVLDKSYEKLGNSIEKAYSKDASGLIEDQNKLLEQQKVLIQQQIREEQDKKKTDNNRIKEWQEQIEDINKVIEENKEKAIDAIFGEDLQSAIENFADAYAEAWANGEDRATSAKDTVKKMMQQMVTESIKAAIQSSSAMEEIRKKLLEFYTDNVLSGWEQEYIYTMAEQLQRELDQQFGWADSLMGGSSTTSQTATGKGFETMSQDTATELNGRFTALQISNEEIKNLTQITNDWLAKIYAQLNGTAVPDISSENRNIVEESYSPTVSVTFPDGKLEALTAEVVTVRSIVDEVRTLHANAALERQTISENTTVLAKNSPKILSNTNEIKQEVKNKL